MPRKIFISYRRDDSADHVHGIAQYIDREFGRGTVFLDVDMHAGTHFPQELEKRLAASAVVLALIGPGWLAARDAQGRRRLDDPADWVRLEVSRALIRGIPVIPILVAGADLPQRSALPADMQGLLEHQAATVASRSFRNDMAGLVRDLAALRGRGSPRRWLTAAAALAAVLVLTGGAVTLWQSRSRDTGSVGAYDPGRSPTNPADVLRACIKEARHPDAAAVIDGLVQKFSGGNYRYGWRVEVAKGEPQTDAIHWQALGAAAAEDGALVLRHDYRNGRLRLVPVVKRQYSTRSIASVSLVLQGLWSADNGYGCAEVTFDGSGRGRGRIGVMTSQHLDTPIRIEKP